LPSQKFLEDAQPVSLEEDDPGAGFEGVYAGQQESSAGILGLLETIRSDFERTARVTASEEKKAAEDFVDFDSPPDGKHSIKALYTSFLYKCHA